MVARFCQILFSYNQGLGICENLDVYGRLYWNNLN